MSHPYRSHYTTTRPKLWTAKSVLLCIAFIAVLLVVVFLPYQGWL